MLIMLEYAIIATYIINNAKYKIYVFNTRRSPLQTGNDTIDDCWLVVTSLTFAVISKGKFYDHLNTV